MFTFITDASTVVRGTRYDSLRYKPSAVGA
jgi:hypothetical protein